MAMRDLRGTAAFNVTVQLSWDDWEYLQMILKGHVLKLDRYCDDELSAMAKEYRIALKLQERLKRQLQSHKSNLETIDQWKQSTMKRKASNSKGETPWR